MEQVVAHMYSFCAPCISEASTNCFGRTCEWKILVKILFVGFAAV